jgi:pimeloyl-ACP methyl ester carboxylesterase
VPIGGNFKIHAEFCRSLKPTCEEDPTIQFLVHGNGYNNIYWNGFGEKLPEYSWVDQAISEDYYTLAIDSLGHGQSAKPDPVGTVQMALEAATYHSILSSLRSGQNPMGLRFSKIVYVGHSYGSFAGNALAARFPGDCDVLILTGYSSSTPFPNPNLEQDWLPASSVGPRSFEQLSSGYQVSANFTGHTQVLYGGSFDPQVADIDFSLRDVATAGEFGSLSLGFQVLRNYTGSVLLVNGEKDMVFCNAVFGSCNNITQQTRQLFPAAKAFDFYLAPDTGHASAYHYSAPETFRQVHAWLARIL